MRAAVECLNEFARDNFGHGGVAITMEIQREWLRRGRGGDREIRRLWRQSRGFVEDGTFTESEARQWLTEAIGSLPQ